MTRCPECGGAIQATTKFYWTLATNGTWELYTPSADNEVELYCENHHQLDDTDLILSLKNEAANIDHLVEMGS